MMGKQVMFERKLATIHDLHDLATHLDEYRKFKRKNYQPQQPLGRQALIRHNYTKVHAYMDKVNGTLQLLKDLTGLM